MELHSRVAGKKLWNYLRVAFFMARKGFASKRKLLMDTNLLMMKRGKLLGKSLRGLMSHHQHSRPETPAFGRCEYEFSCSNSPNPVFFHAKRRHNYFPCLHPVVEEPPDDDTLRRPAVVRLPKLEYSPHCSSVDLLASGVSRTPLLSPFSVRVSNYSSGGEDDDDGGLGQEVDDEAEEFIRRFYEQLRAQSRIALLQYQEKQYQEMLVREL
ncbi:uncharacterized protein LOC135598149 [Musa acuminata AAA Group]|uniref:uncharacterized protein LOC135598149 n=1 Tax=Musa acuminata AAA Group TaxID=214697 RepID=UPI0031E09137